MATVSSSSWRYAEIRQQKAGAPGLPGSSQALAPAILRGLAPYFFRYLRQRRAHWRESAMAVALAAGLVAGWLFLLRGGL